MSFRELGENPPKAQRPGQLAVMEGPTDRRTLLQRPCGLVLSILEARTIVFNYIFQRLEKTNRIAQ